MTETQIGYPAGEQPVKRMNLLQRITGILLSPGRTTADLIEKPRLIFPLILVAVSMLALYMARLPLYQDYLRQNTIKSLEYVQSLTGQTITPDMVEQSISRGFTQSVILLPVGSLFMWLLTTVIFFAVFKIFGSKGKFKQFFSITGYAYVITALYFLIVLAASFLTGSLHIDVPLTSLANLFSPDATGGFLYGVAKGIDIFSIWSYCVIAIGLAAVSGFRKRNAYILVAVIFVAGLLITGSMTIAQNLITGG